MPRALTRQAEGVGEAAGLQPQRGERRAARQQQGQGLAAGVPQRVQAQVQLLQALPAPAGDREEGFEGWGRGGNGDGREIWGTDGEEIQGVEEERVGGTGKGLGGAKERLGVGGTDRRTQG